MPIDGRTAFVGITFDDMTLPQATDWVLGHIGSGAFHYIVTPNVDHRVRLDKMGSTDIGGALSAACTSADLILCDSRILARLAKFFGKRLVVVPGSDLTAALLARVSPVTAIAVIGGDAETPATLTARYGLTNLTQHIPPMGMLGNPQAMEAALDAVRHANADLVFIAVGSPQGEILAHRLKRSGIAHGVGLCIGASIDFLTGRQTRAPLWMRKAGLEWLFRLLSEPRRMWRRYLVDGPRIFRIALRDERRS